MAIYRLHASITKDRYTLECSIVCDGHIVIHGSTKMTNNSNKINVFWCSNLIEHVVNFLRKGGGGGGGGGGGHRPRPAVVNNSTRATGQRVVTTRDGATREQLTDQS